MSSALRDARSAADRARRLLRSRGYYAATVDPMLDRRRQAYLQIATGPVFTIASIDTDTGEDADARETARAAITLQTGAPLRAQSIIDAEAQALVALHNSGWPDAQIRERRVVVDHATEGGRITFRYDPGPWSVYGEIDRDTAAWNPQFIARISPFRRGTPGQPSGHAGIPAPAGRPRQRQCGGYHAWPGWGGRPPAGPCRADPCTPPLRGDRAELFHQRGRGRHGQLDTAQPVRQ